MPFVLPQGLDRFDDIAPGCPSMANQPASNHRSGPADTGEAMDVDRSFYNQSSIDGIENAPHDGRCGHIHVLDGEAAAPSVRRAHQRRVGCEKLTMKIAFVGRHQIDDFTDAAIKEGFDFSTRRDDRACPRVFTGQQH